MERICTVSDFRPRIIRISRALLPQVACASFSLPKGKHRLLLLQYISQYHLKFLSHYQINAKFHSQYTPHFFLQCIVNSSASFTKFALCCTYHESARGGASIIFRRAPRRDMALRMRGSSLLSLAAAAAATPSLSTVAWVFAWTDGRTRTTSRPTITRQNNGRPEVFLPST